MRSLKRKFMCGFALVSCAAVLAACSSSGSKSPQNASSSGGSGKVIKLGLLTSVTGAAASSFGQTTVDAANAAIKLANDTNALGDGTKFELVVADDQTSADAALAGFKDLVQRQHVFAVLNASAFFFAAEPFAVQQKVPVLGAGFDPGFANPAYTNLFANWGSASGDYPDFKNLGTYFKNQGGTTFCGVGNTSPSSVGGVKELAASVKRDGLATPYVNVSLPVTTTDFTPVALAIKSAGCDVVGGQLTGSENIALIKAVNDAGVKLKASYLAGGYSQALLQDPAVKDAIQGWGFGVQWQPSPLQTDATKRLQGALAKYAGWNEPNPAGGTPWGWFPVELAVHGFKLAGSGASQADFIAKLRKETSFDYGGLTCPVDFSKFAYVSSITGTGCTWIAEAKGDNFISATGKDPIMLTVIEGTSNK
jgi:ABC-type branched-subunit amino acid transport system substrate-binding protein